MSEKTTDWKKDAYYYATHENNGDFNLMYEDTIQSENMFQTRYSGDFVKNLVDKFGYEYVSKNVADDADYLKKANAKKAEEVANRADNAIKENNELNDIIDRAEDEEDA